MVTPHRVAGHLVEELVSADLDHALSAEEARVLEEHLRGCGVCRALVTRQERLRTELRTLGARTTLDERDRIWTEIASRRAVPRRAFAGGLVQLGFAAAVLLAAALTSFLLPGRLPAAAPPPVREVVASSSFELPGGNGTLTIEQGNALARPGAQIGVGARAELRLAQPPTRGSAEIRFRAEGESSYGVLGSAPDLAGSTRLSFGGAFPRPAGPDPVTYEVWVHFESDAGSVDSTPILIDVTATRRGEEGRAR